MRVIVRMVNIFQTSYLLDYISQGGIIQRVNINILRISYIMILSKSHTALYLLTNTLDTSLNSMRYHYCEYLVVKSHSAFPPFDNNVNIINERYYHN